MVTNIKRLAILGCTGSIGQQTLDIVRRFPDSFQVIGLACNTNVGIFKNQIDEFKPLFIHCSTESENLPSTHVSTLEEIASIPQVDIVVIATTGKAGLKPALAAIKAGKKVALANKEILVMAGDLITRMAAQYNAAILPIDSEHSAIWQCLQGETGKISRLLLTASGGPFIGMSKDQLEKVTVDKALDHPTWKMGKKVTIDSATLFNKGLEAIEAHWLFDISYDQIEILIHRQSIVHSMIEFQDGSIKAQLSNPDMRLPIQYALFHSQRVANSRLKPLDFKHLITLSFEPVHFDDFPCLTIALEAATRGETYPAVICAADEVAVNLFLNQRINFPDIAKIIGETMHMHEPICNPVLEDILQSDEWARKTAIDIAGKVSL